MKFITSTQLQLTASSVVHRFLTGWLEFLAVGSE
jgi:hypothetical protein